MNKYELMAANIERAYYQASKGQIQARVWDVKITPACARFRFTVGASTREKAVTGLAAELAYNLGLPSVRIVREGGEYFLEAPRDVKRQLALTDLLRTIKNVPPYTALLGMQTDSTPLLLRIDSPDVPHALLAGTTGSGKTALLRTLLVSLALYNRPGQLMLALVDPKGRGLAPLAPLRHIWRGYGVVEDPDDAETLLGELVDEMERRDRTRRNLPRIVLAIDEFADLLDANRSVGELVQRLTQRGREAGIHVIVATQRPTATLVGSMLKANLPVRLIGKVVSPEEAKIAAGLKETDAELLQGRGDFLLIALGHTVRFQAAYALPRDVDGLVTLATTGAVEGQAHRRRAWADLPLHLPPALVKPDPAPLPGRVENGNGTGGGAGAADATGARDVPAASAGTIPISHSPSPIPIALPAPAYPPRGAGFRRGKRPAPLGEGSRLRARYSIPQRLAALQDAEGNRTLACQSLYGYSDAVTLRLMAEAIAFAEAQDPAVGDESKGENS